MTTVNPVKVAYGQRAGLSQCRVLMAAKYFHEANYRFLAARSSRLAGCRAIRLKIVMKPLYIVG